MLRLKFISNDLLAKNPAKISLADFINTYITICKLQNAKSLLFSLQFDL